MTKADARRLGMDVSDSSSSASSSDSSSDEGNRDLKPYKKGGDHSTKEHKRKKASKGTEFLGWACTTCLYQASMVFIVLLTAVVLYIILWHTNLFEKIGSALTGATTTATINLKN